MHTPISLPRALCAYLLAVSSAATVFTLPRFGAATLVLAWILACAAALLPYAAGIAYANWRRIRRRGYFVGGALLTALGFLPLLAWLHPVRRLVLLAPMLALAGLAAGGACWLVLKSPAR